MLLGKYLEINNFLKLKTGKVYIEDENLQSFKLETHNMNSYLKDI